ncbi:hypothetical protein ACFPT7_22635 [Acidicapsa dinghuensis]|uniref:Uncharacterized protein n=1 Tax=Acidicapsa dinghuensis TaxID=2218256 RepID=A0ABW1ELD7_9BACT|nr:hypothetical protein [Acidicapsa dinghuensis]
MPRRIFFVLLLFVSLLPLYAEDGGGVVFKSGSVTHVKPGAAGRLVLTDSEKLVFESAGGNLEIPFQKIQAFEHTKEVAVHMGWAPAVLIETIKQRRRNHFLKLSYLDGNDVDQFVIFQIPKQMPEILMMTLLMRSPDASCQPSADCDSIFRPRGHRQVKLEYRGALSREIQPLHATPLGQTP